MSQGPSRVSIFPVPDKPCLNCAMATTTDRSLEGLKTHGWKKGQSCRLFVSALGHLGDCLQQGIPWPFIVLMAISALILVIITIILIHRG